MQDPMSGRDLPGNDFDQRPAQRHIGRWVLLVIVLLVGGYFLLRGDRANSLLVRTGLSQAKEVTLSDSKVKVGYPTAYVQVNDDVNIEALGVYYVILAESQACKAALLQQSAEAQRCIYVTVRLMPQDLLEAEDNANTSAYLTKTQLQKRPYTMQGIAGEMQTLQSQGPNGLTAVERMQQYEARIIIPLPKYKGFSFYVRAKSASPEKLQEEETVVQFIAEHSSL